MHLRYPGPYPFLLQSMYICMYLVLPYGSSALEVVTPLLSWDVTRCVRAKNIITHCVLSLGICYGIGHMHTN
jgi:hypothetical protein